MDPQRSDAAPAALGGFIVPPPSGYYQGPGGPGYYSASGSPALMPPAGVPGYCNVPAGVPGPAGPPHSAAASSSGTSAAPHGYHFFGPHGYVPQGNAPMLPVNVTYSVAAASPAQSPLHSRAPYHHYPPAKTGPGRPRGSKNKRPNGEEDYPPQPTRSSSFRAVNIPDVHEWDFEIATQESAACSKCALNKAMFLCLPCSHYGFCLECLQRQESKCQDLDSPVVCMGCDRPVTEYLKYFRASLTN